jgi:hypothetical protein
VPEIYNPLFGYDSFNAIFDSPMSFRDRHRFLDRVYNSCQNPGEMPAKELESISQRVGLLMEEVLSWFDDEKERRTKLLTNNQRQQERVRNWKTYYRLLQHCRRSVFLFHSGGNEADLLSTSLQRP